MIDKDDFFDNLINVNLSKGTKKNKLRNIVFKKRYKLIQFAENTESKIAKLILDAQNEIFQIKDTSLKKIDPFLRYTLLDDVDPTFRKNLEKLLCTSLEQLRANIGKDNDSIKRFEEKTKIKEFKKNHKKEIQTLKSKIQILLDDLYEEELIYRSKLFKDLRTRYKDWTQLQFSQLYKRIDPISPMSPSRVSRFEQRSRKDTKLNYETPINQRRVDMSLSEARNVAKTFGIDAGLFLPSTIASDY
ncbi:MAG: hypothetical protein JXA94_00375 [Parachlamydiales bacterium]|nr:hypothetical protein [Parachlamydiales bacterium]